MNSLIRLAARRMLATIVVAASVLIPSVASYKCYFGFDLRTGKNIDGGAC